MVTGMFEITDVERAAWQRRAASRLATILDEHRNLPPIAWTLATAGSILVGRVDRGQQARVVRAVFDDWCRALQVRERSETTGRHGDAYLWATIDTGGVRVSVTATVCAIRDGQGQR